MSAQSKIVGFLLSGLLLLGCGEEQGDPGEVGLPGEAGPSGPAGPRGPAGADGQDGADGRDGVDGMDGVDGLDGRDVSADALVGPFFAENDRILTDPYLTGPTADGVVVAWFTEFEGDGHEVVFGDALQQRVAATTTRMSQMFEDASSRIAGRPTPVPAEGEAIVDRPVYRHAALVTGLEPDVRVPYYAVSTVNGISFKSRVFTLQPLPSGDRPVRLLLTSDQQNRAMAPANYEKVVETVGLVDAVLFAGDFVDTPNRASEWFDRDDEGRPSFFPSMQGRFKALFPEHPYAGGQILQHAPVFGTIGNHESPGRFDRADTLGTMDNEPRPRWFAAWQWEQLSPAEQAATNMTRDEFVRARSFDHVTYYEMWDLPENGVQGEDPENFFSLTYGNLHLISMNVSRVWRNWNNGFTNGGRGKFAEPSTTINDLDTWGFGDIFFGDYSPGSAQRIWLGDQLSSAELASADFSVVLTHQTMFGNGDNAVPVMADPEARVTFVDGREPIFTTFPASEADWQEIVDAAEQGLIESVNYRYRRADDLWLGVEDELLAAGVDLVLAGHSHIWSRTFVEENGVRLNYLETSNVGNTFGPTVNFNNRVPWARQFYPDPELGTTRDPDFWDPNDYVRTGDPQGRPDIPPSRVPDVDLMRDVEGGPEGLPFISSNRITVFSVLDTEDGTVRSYGHDTAFPRAPAVEVDCFALDENASPNPCDTPR